MKVSVAMAAFNGEKFIEEQLASILSQTRPVDEVIICDDRSSDRTAELAEDFIARKHLQDTWRVEVNTQNVGYASNFIGAVRLQEMWFSFAIRTTSGFRNGLPRWCTF